MYRETPTIFAVSTPVFIGGNTYANVKWKMENGKWKEKLNVRIADFGLRISDLRVQILESYRVAIY